jgi:hypothetical protein
MKIPFYISVGASGICLLLSIIILTVGGSNQSLQNEIQKQQQALQAQQEPINAGSQISTTVGPNLLKDMATSAVKNDKMKSLLAKHGYNIQVNTPAPGAGTPAPK